MAEKSKSGSDFRFSMKLPTLRQVANFFGQFIWDQVSSGFTRMLINTAVCLVLMVLSFILGAWLL